MKKEKTQKQDTFSFRDAFARLDSINQWFQKEDIEIDEALEKYKAGMELVRQAQEHLSKAENEFKKIKKDLQEEDEK